MVRRFAPLLRISLVLFFGLTGDGESAEPTPGTRSTDIGQLIKQLGSEQFQEREAASKTLEALGRSAVPALRKAVKSSDLEVRHRAAGLLQAILPSLQAQMEAHVQKLGGTIGVQGRNGKELVYAVTLSGTKVDDRFLAQLQGLQISTLHLTQTGITDAGLALLAQHPELDILDLPNAKITDAGLKHLKSLQQLWMLDLSNTAVTDRGIAQLAGLNLTNLELAGTRVTDAGLPHLKELPKLQRLYLDRTAITDVALARLKDCNRLDELGLAQTRVTDAGLAHLSKFVELSRLVLNDTRVTDAGLVHLKKLTRLRELHLEGTGVTDAGLAHLKGLENLSGLYLEKTKVTAAGIARLKKALPDVRVYPLNPH